MPKEAEVAAYGRGSATHLHSLAPIFLIRTIELPNPHVFKRFRLHVPSSAGSREKVLAQ